MDVWIWVIILLLTFLLLLSFYRMTRRTEHYEIAKDESSMEVFERLKIDLAKLYPHQFTSLDLKGLVSCVPEDSFTEDKKKVSICLRNKEGKFYPYEKLMKIGIHELAHAMSKQHDPDHVTPEFIGNYTALMNKARSLGFKVE